MRIIAILLLLLTPALAQKPDPNFMQKALGVLQAQRNTAMDMQANAETRAAILAEEIAKLKEQIEALKNGQPAAGEGPPTK